MREALNTMVTAASCFSRGYAFPEGPRWHGGSLWFSDQHDGLVRRLGPAGEVLEEFRVPGDPSGLGWMPNGELLVVSMHERRVYRRHEGALQVWADLRALHPGPSNDMVVDAEGRAYVGNIGFDFANGETPCTTAVALVQADGSVELACDGLLCPNGSVISADGRTLIIAESLAFRLHAWTRDADGRLGNHRVFAEFTDGSIPDGICLDAEGCVWVATAGPSVLRVREGGEILERIDIENGKAYACMLGGADRRDLFICVAPDHQHAVTLRERGGRIDLARVRVPGSGLP